jgi:redox-sensitive bicupin YhaK (pirin superfamily)
LGKAFGRSSPVPLNSDLFYAEVFLKTGRPFRIPAEGRDTAVYVVGGEVNIEGREVHPTEMAVAKAGEDLLLEAKEDARVMIIGGRPVGERFIFWNFVSSSEEKIEQAKRLWSPGPSRDNSKFKPIPGDEAEFIPLPEDALRPKGTIM